MKGLKKERERTCQVILYQFDDRAFLKVYFSKWVLIIMLLF